MCWLKYYLKDRGPTISKVAEWGAQSAARRISKNTKQNKTKLHLDALQSNCWQAKDKQKALQAARKKWLNMYKGLRIWEMGYSSSETVEPGSSRTCSMSQRGEKPVNHDLYNQKNYPSKVKDESILQ